MIHVQNIFFVSDNTISEKFVFYSKSIYYMESGLKKLDEIVVAGLMSGSSLDGLDIAICRFAINLNGDLDFHIIEAVTIPYQPKWKESLTTCMNLSVKEYFTFSTNYSRYIASLVNEYINRFDKVTNLIATHGHTIDHRPSDGVSIQLCDPGILSAMTRIDCIADFRIQDITLGGQGAPIIPIAEKLLWSDINGFINLGGIANISIHSEEGIIAWDSVPCNQVLNHLSVILGEEYDKGGNFAKQGSMNHKLYTAWSQFGYFDHSIPKSLDNNWIRDEYIPLIKHLRVKPHDALHTACHFIADKITEDIVSYADSIPNKIMITGGGTHNEYLRSCISDKLKQRGVELVIPSKMIIDYKEAVMTALMGYLFVNDQYNTIPSATGASRPSIAGKYCKA